MWLLHANYSKSRFLSSYGRLHNKTVKTASSICFCSLRAGVAAQWVAHAWHLLLQSTWQFLNILFLLLLFLYGGWQTRKWHTTATKLKTIKIRSSMCYAKADVEYFMSRIGSVKFHYYTMGIPGHGRVHYFIFYVGLLPRYAPCSCFTEDKK